MNFKLKFLCILFLNFLPQSFASPKNSRSRRADDVLDKLEYLQAAEESLGKLKLERQIENGASLAISVRDHQIGDKTSGDNFLNHENGQRGNDLSGRNGDDENGQNEKGLTGKNGDDEEREKAEGLTRKNGDGEDGHKVEGVTGKNGDGDDGHKVEGVTGNNGDGEDGEKGKGLRGENGDGTREEEPPLNQATGEDNNTNKQIPYSSRRGLEENVNGGDFRLKDRKSGVYGDSDSYEHTLSHFAGFIVTSIVVVFAVYAVHHNRQKIVAIIIESRNDNRSRKLETNMEEAMPAMKNTHSTYVYQNL
ncbi:PREDICTED: S-antigen protein-like isoform X5 [Acropora digitifera]|uniref:S-antigen protein-like isoform X5 n=1 Tax=Acropora digitifera TaxID=70779 RepID=UPI00077AFCE6|nr:PREDICTED: S-antigen protein-like isoform X5 [Acropora digitifera]